MRWTDRRRERGAAALEFGLISPLLFAVLFGTITYGLWLNDSMNLRQGLREASRQGVVANYGAVSSCATTYSIAPSANVKNLVCTTKSEVAAYTGKTYVKVLLPDGWVRGKELVVCGMIKADRLPGLVPLPNDRIIRFASRMSIETATPGQVETGGEEVPPSGVSWSWCT
ncbi:TadE/TadG family type IV pilus assembly protein [Nocardioides mesophilus]|uniref:Pilus assembly protein n=1 Tax=Nocardioides mesophilus TaxID=433659 RepID=A0A7G9RC25_9ACTN|nr:TadE/TadG family type IV pilus assembly protein [Nocardioides mesophilus]QNN53150.1 pilus assembly protein [Nocardioides mesophilus]